ncbi:Hcp family type VI secretion system effector [Nannocystis sp.]|uniref:Hcp family type VI secretion system effector n=1 Tax=Nannocystis sp. TaxID=1962667 RepID=UPI0025DBA2B0|nr:Hcp family type VI secretion system effector [Nannocystis sp.]
MQRLANFRYPRRGAMRRRYVMKKWIQSLLVVGALTGVALGPGAEADAALNAYLKLKGQKQGEIKGSVTQKGKEGAIAVIAVSHSIVSPRDPQSGLPTGQRMHKPFVFTKEIDKSTPVLYQVLVSNENLTEVEFTVYGPDKVGKPSLLYTVKLTNANIASIDLVTPETGAPRTQVTMTYQKIEWTWVDGGITASDDWEAPVQGAVKPPVKPAKPK